MLVFILTHTHTHTHTHKYWEATREKNQDSENKTGISEGHRENETWNKNTESITNLTDSSESNALDINTVFHAGLFLNQTQ